MKAEGKRHRCAECHKLIDAKKGILTVGEKKHYHYDPCFKNSRIGLEWRKVKILDDMAQLEHELRKVNEKLSAPLLLDRGIRPQHA